MFNKNLYKLQLQQNSNNIESQCNLIKPNKRKTQTKQPQHQLNKQFINSSDTRKELSAKIYECIYK